MSNTKKNQIVRTSSSSSYSSGLHTNRGITRREKEAIETTREEMVRQEAAIRAKEAVERTGAEATGRIYEHAAQVYTDTSAAILAQRDKATDQDHSDLVNGFALDTSEQLQKDLKMLIKEGVGEILEVTSLPTYQPAPPPKKGLFGK